MDLKFEVQGRIQKPLEDVFEAVFNPKIISEYFVTGGASGPLVEGQTVQWEFADFPGPFPVTVKQSQKNKKIVILWDATSPLKSGEKYQTAVEFNFEALDSKNTLVKISESGFEDSENGYSDSRSNSQGWMAMLCFLKAYLDHGVRLRKGMFN